MADYPNQNKKQDWQGQSPLGEEFVEESPTVGVPWHLMIFTFILFLLSIILFAGLRFGYAGYLDNQIAEVDNKMEELNSQVTKGEQEDLLDFYSQLLNLKKILKERGFSQNIFSFLEDNTHSLVYFTGVKYSDAGPSLELTGQANSPKTVVEQTALFEKLSEVRKVSLKKLSVNESENVANFKINIIFDPAFFKKFVD